MNLRQHLENRPPPLTPVHCAQWDGTIDPLYLKPLSAWDSIMMECATAESEKLSGSRQAKMLFQAARICVLRYCDAAGNPVFKDDDTAWLLKQPLSVLTELAEHAMEDSAITGNPERKKNKRSTAAEIRVPSVQGTGTG